MAYEINDLLMRCKVADFEFFIEQIDSYVNFSSDEELKNLLLNYKDTKLRREKRSLAYALEREIRYLGSSEAAYSYRKFIKNEEPAGVSIIEIIEDVSKHLKMSKPYSKNPEECLMFFAEEYTRKNLSVMSSEDRRSLFAELNIVPDNAADIVGKIAADPKKVIGILYEFLTADQIKKLYTAFIAKLLSRYIGDNAAIALLAATLPGFIGTRFFTPLAGIGVVATGHTLQGPAFRKTVPIIAHLAQVAVRDDETYLKLPDLK